MAKESCCQQHVNLGPGVEQFVHYLSFALTGGELPGDEIFSGRDVGDCDSECGSGSGRQPQDPSNTATVRAQGDLIKSGSVTDWMRYQVDITSHWSRSQDTVL